MAIVRGLCLAICLTATLWANSSCTYYNKADSNSYRRSNPTYQQGYYHRQSGYGHNGGFLQRLIRLGHRAHRPTPKTTCVDLRHKFQPPNPYPDPNPGGNLPNPSNPNTGITNPPITTQPPPPPPQSPDYCRAASAGVTGELKTVFPPEQFDFFSQLFSQRIPYQGQVDVDKRFAVIITDENADLDEFGAEETRTKIDFDGDVPLLAIKAIDDDGDIVCFATEFPCNDFNYWATLVNSYILAGVVDLEEDVDALEYKVDDLYDIVQLYQDRPNIQQFCSEAQYVFHVTPGFEPIDNLSEIITAINHAGYVNIYIGNDFDFE